MPIYYVIAEYITNPGMYPITQILRVYACEIGDIEYLWKQAYDELNLGQRRYTTQMYVREPTNPFKGWVNE